MGSSVQSLAGSVTNWLNDRVQLPGLVDTPVRESNNTSTTTTTTQRPDVVVRVQQRPQSSRRPVIRISNRNRPNRYDFDSLEDDDDDGEEEDDDDVQQQSNEQEDDENDEDEPDDDENDSGNDNRIKNDEDDDEEGEDVENTDNDNEETEDDDEEELVIQPPKKRRRPVQQQQQQQNKRRVVQQQNRRQPNRRISNAAAQQQRRRQQQRVKQQQQQQQNFLDDGDEFFYGEHPSMKRSQSQTGFIQLGQQNLLNQIRQLTRGQSPAEIGNTMRRPQNKRRQQATLFINRNGQTVYMAPELMGSGGNQFEYAPNVVVKKRVKPPNAANNIFPQPPLTVPLKRKGRPTQYITIPWSQLGISPPNQLVSLTDGIQSKPLILNIPQSAVNQMQNPNRRKKRPVITSNAVPLLAEASLMDIFKPPRIPPSRTGSNATRKPNIPSTPIHIVAKPKPNKHSTSALLPQRVRPGTIVEMAPALEAAENSSDAETENAGSTILEDQFIIVGNDEEPGLTRQVQSVSGDDAHYVQGGGKKPYYEVLNRGGGHFALRKTGRALEQREPIGIVNSHGGVEEQIPVQVITEELQQKKVVQPIVNASVSEVVAENVAKTKEPPAVQVIDKEATGAKEITKVEETPVADIKL